MDNIFLQASRLQLRFRTGAGHITTEDLWSLNLKSLDALAMSVDEQIKPERKSFLENPDPKTRASEAENTLRLEILKAVITIKQDENKAALAESGKRQQREFLKGLLEKKKIGEMENMTAEQIEAQLAALG